MIQAPQERRLTDQLLKAFHQACDNADAESAERLLAMIDTLNARTRPLGLKDRRQSRMDLREARERVRKLREDPSPASPDPGQDTPADAVPNAALNSVVEPAG